MKKLIILLFITALTVTSYATWDNTKPADTSVWNNAAGEIRDNWDAMEIVFGVDLSSPSPIGKEVAFYGTTFAAAITAIDDNDVTLIVNEAEIVAADVTVPTNVSLFFAKGGSLAVANAKTVTINGDIISGSYQIFSGAGDVTFGTDAPGIINVRWFGATGDGTTDDTATVQVALNRTVASNKTLKLSAGTYCLESQVSYDITTTGNPERIIIIGDKYQTTILDKCTTTSCLSFTRSSPATRGFFTLKDLIVRINGNKPTANVISFVDMATSRFLIEGCIFDADDKTFKHFLHLEDLWDGSIRDTLFDDIVGGIGLWYDCPDENGGNVLLDNVGFGDFGVGVVIKGNYTTNNVKFNECKWVSTTNDYYTKMTLTASPAAGQKVINIAATSGMVAGQAVFLQGWVTASPASRSEVNFIASVDDSTTLTLRYNLAYAYDSGSNFLRAPIGLVGKQYSFNISLDTCHFEVEGVPVVLHKTRGWRFNSCIFSFFDQGIMIYPEVYYVDVANCNIEREETGAYLVYVVDQTNASETRGNRITVGPKTWSYNDSNIDDQLLYTDFTIPTNVKNRYEIITREGISTNRECLVSTTILVDLAGTADTETVLYAIPGGFTFVPTKVVLRTFSAEEHGTPPIITLGTGDTTAEDFLGNQTLSNITANYAREVIELRPLPAATPVTSDSVVAAGTFVLEITQANGAALTCTVDTFGYLY